MAVYDDGSNDGLLTEERNVWKEDEEHQRQLRHTRAIIIPWVLALFFFCTTCLFAWQSRAVPACEALHDVSHNGTYETGYSTDFVSESPGIDIHITQQHFTNDLRFNATSQQLYNEPLDPAEVTYVGPPSPALDAAWHALLHDQYVAITPAEAAQFPAGHRAPIFWDHAEHYYFELSVFHNLHCLNELRRRVDYDYYYSASREEASAAHTPPDDVFAAREHVDHCVDQIRQALQCHADLTPVPMMQVEGRGAFIGNGEVHTCRDFERVREWVRERGVRAKSLGG